MSTCMENVTFSQLKEWKNKKTPYIFSLQFYDSMVMPILFFYFYCYTTILVSEPEVSIPLITKPGNEHERELLSRTTDT